MVLNTFTQMKTWPYPPELKSITTSTMCFALNNIISAKSPSPAKRASSNKDLFTQEQSIGVLVHYLKNAIAHQALEKVAFHDSLTGVMNRTALDELLPKETKRAQRYGYSLSLLMIDIDHFKSINDRIGHIGGDAILKQSHKQFKPSFVTQTFPFDTVATSSC